MRDIANMIIKTSKAGRSIHYCIHTKNQLNPWSKVFPEKLKLPQPVMKFPEFYETRRFINAFTRVRHLYPSWATSIQSIPPTPLLENPF
jgi:hypothetical protein